MRSLTERILWLFIVAFLYLCVMVVLEGCAPVRYEMEYRCNVDRVTGIFLAPSIPKGDRMIELYRRSNDGYRKFLFSSDRVTCELIEELSA